MKLTHDIASLSTFKRAGAKMEHRLKKVDRSETIEGIKRGL